MGRLSDSLTTGRRHLRGATSLPKYEHLYQQTTTGYERAVGVAASPIIDTELNEYFHKRLKNELAEKDPVYGLFSSVTYRETREGMGQICIRVTGKHQASWLIFYRPRPGVSQSKYKLSDYHSISPAQAIKLAIEARNAISEGKHPKDAHRQKVASEGPTLAECLEDKILQRGVRPERAKGLAESTIHTHRKHMRKIARYGLADKLMTTITSYEVKKLHEQIPKDVQAGNASHGSGYAIADKCVNLINELYLYAKKRYETEDLPPKKIITHNPCDPLKATKTVGSGHRTRKASDRSIRQADLKRFWGALEALKEYVPDRHNRQVESHIVAHAYLKFMLLTGMRGGALSGLKFSMHDSELKALWIVGSNKFLMKAKKDFMLPLSNEANTIILEMHERHAKKSDYIFPTVKGDQGVEVGVSRWVRWIRERVNIDFTAHGLRSTFITCAEACDVPINIYKQLVDHGEQPQDVTSGYTRTEIAHMRAESQRVTDFILDNAGVNRKKKEKQFTADANPFNIKEKLHKEIEEFAASQGIGVREAYEKCMKLGVLAHKRPEMKGKDLLDILNMM